MSKCVISRASPSFAAVPVFLVENSEFPGPSLSIPWVPTAQIGRVFHSGPDSLSIGWIEVRETRRRGTLLRC